MSKPVLSEITDEEVLRVMHDGGHKLCEYAMEQWISNKYGLDHETNYAFYRRWREISERISQLSKRMKALLNNGIQE